MQRCEKSIMNSKLFFFSKKISTMSTLLYNLNKPRAASSMLKRRKEKRDKGWSIKKTPLDPHLALFHML